MTKISQPEKATGSPLFKYPKGYWKMNPWEREKVAGGCGPNAWKFDLVPDTIYGVSVKKACDIHDVAYHIGQTLEDKDAADKAFHDNLKAIINHSSLPWILKKLAHIRCWSYYKAVSVAGKRCFLAGKNGIKI